MTEILAIEKLHRAAQARLGLAVAMLTRDRWASVQAANPAAAGRQWAETAAEAVMAARELSAFLAITYYQLARAVELGITLGALPSGRTPTLGNLRDQFLEQVMSIAELGEETEASPLHALLDGDTGEGQLTAIDLLPTVQEFLDSIDSGTDAKEIKVDEYTWMPARSDNAMVREIIQELTAAAVTPQEEEAKRQSREGVDSKTALARINESHIAKGQLGAGRADKYAMGAGREMLNRAGAADRRVLKFARGTGPNPCAFCAMLASRGWVYSSAGTATTRQADGTTKAYHDNCHCFAIARWTEQSPLPPLTEFFESQWQSVTEDYPSAGNGKLNAWRRWLNGLRRAGTMPPI